MSEAPSRCPSCSAPLHESDVSCPFCGYDFRTSGLAGEPPRPPPPERPAEVRRAPRPTQPPRSEGIDGVSTRPPPWESRRQVGFFPGLWITWRESVFRPVEFFRRLPPRAGYGSPIGYALLVFGLGLLLSLYWSALQSALQGGMEEGIAVALAGGLLSVGVSFAVLLPIQIATLFVTSAIIHLGFWAAGASRRGFEGTFRAVAYSAGPAAFAVFPFFGSALGLVWGMALVYIGVREVQRTTNARAALGFTLPLLVFLVLLITLAMLVELILGSLGVSGAV